MQAYHIAVWIDHREAKVFRVGALDSGEDVIRAEHAEKHIHHKAGTFGAGHGGAGHAGEDLAFLDAVAKDIADAHEILIVGPAQAKLHLFKRLQTHHPKIAEKVVGIESVDHPSDGQMVAYARHYFHKVDRMRPQVG